MPDNAAEIQVLRARNGVEYPLQFTATDANGRVAPVVSGRPWWLDDPTYRVWNFLGNGASPVPEAESGERYVVIGYVLEPMPGEDGYKAAVTPGPYTESDVGPAVELDPDGGLVTAILTMGAVTNDAAIEVTFEQSHNGTEWVTVLDAQIPQQSAAGAIAAISFPISRQYIRARYEIYGEPGAEAYASVSLSQTPTVGHLWDNDSRTGSPLLLVCGAQLAALGSVHVPTAEEGTVYTPNLRGWVATIRQAVPA